MGKQDLEVSYSDARIGPDGLALKYMPEEAPRVVSLADILEITRYLHADLKHIHRAFGALHGVEARMQDIETIALRQQMETGKFVNAVADVIGKQTDMLRILENIRLAQTHQEQERLRQKDEDRKIIEALYLEVQMPWYRKMMRWFKREK